MKWWNYAEEWWNLADKLYFTSVPSSQANLFDPPATTGIKVNPSVTEKPERKRLSNQHMKILERLRCGEATNAQLSVVALRYSARIEELRRAGYVIAIVRRDYDTGCNVYRLEREP